MWIAHKLKTRNAYQIIAITVLRYLLFVIAQWFLGIMIPYSKVVYSSLSIDINQARNASMSLYSSNIFFLYLIVHTNKGYTRKVGTMKK